MPANYAVKEESLAPQGRLKVAWAEQHMPVIAVIKKRFERENPLKDTVIAACLHVTAETAVLMHTLKAGGADVVLCAANPLSTQDDVAASLVKEGGISVFALRGEDTKTYYEHVHKVLDSNPHIIMDVGGDLVTTLHSERSPLLERVKGGIEETTTGVNRFKNMEKEGTLHCPIIAVNDAQTKHVCENVYGTGQSSLDGVMRATNVLLAGKKVVIAGYGWCGKGVAMRARGLGARVMVTEVDSLRALEAVMDEFWVVRMREAARTGDVFITATGDRSVIREEHIMLMKDGAILCNTGHFNVEVDISGLEQLAQKKRKVREHVVEYVLKDGRRLYLLGEGRVVNLACAEGNPSQVMDMGFSLQALSVEYLKKSASLEKKVYSVPYEIDVQIADLKLKSMGVEIDTLSDEQKMYVKSWKSGT